MTYKNKKIKFIKPILDKLQWTGKREWYSAQDVESLCIQVNKNSKSYYAQWATIKIVDGLRKTVGHRKYLAPYFWSIADVKTELRKNIDAWKKASRANVDSLNVGALVSEFERNGIHGQRVKTRGKRLHYKAKTSKGYKEILDRYILLETIKDPVELKAKMTDPIKFQGAYHEGALKDVPLDEIKRKDIEIWMERLSDTPAAANNALAALSIAFEFDLKKAKDAMLPDGAVNPCIRISKYEIAKDKKYIDMEKVIKMKDYMMAEQWRDPHYLTYYYCLLDSGERQSDWRGTYWKKPNNLKEAVKAGCTGYLYKKWDHEFNEHITYLHILDSKNRKPADVELTAEVAMMLDKLNELRSGKESWSYESPFVFPQTERIDRSITETTYKFKMARFHYKFGLAERTLIRSTGKKRKLYKYKHNYTLKNLRKTFATYYSEEHGVEATQDRMRHSSIEVTQNHYVNFKPKEKRTRHMYSPRRSRSRVAPVAIQGGKHDK